MNWLCFSRDPGYELKTQVFYVVTDCVTANIRRRFKAAEKLNNTFCVLWKYSTTKDAAIERQARALFETHSIDISENIINEIKDLKKIYFANILSSNLGSFDLLIKLHELHLETLFSDVCDATHFLHHSGVRGIR